VFAEKGGMQTAPARRPAGMCQDAWHSLQDSFALILAAAARHNV